MYAHMHYSISIVVSRCGCTRTYQHACMDVCMYACMHVDTYKYTMYLYICSCVYIYMAMYTHSDIHVDA